MLTNTKLKLTIPENVTHICVGENNTAPSLGTLYVSSISTIFIRIIPYKLPGLCYDEPFTWTFEAGDKSGNTVFDIDPDDPGPWNIEVYEYNVIIRDSGKTIYFKFILQNSTDHTDRNFGYTSI